MLFYKIISLTIFYFICQNNNVVAQTESYFSELTEFNKDGFTFRYSPKNFKQNFHRCNEVSKKSKFYCPDEYPEDLYYILGKLKLSNQGDSISLAFSPGASGDPEFIFVNSNEEIIARVEGEELNITSSGNIYTVNNSNNMFLTRCKFQFVNEVLIETKQPYLYIGLKTKTLKSISIFESSDLKTKVASLPADYNIEVILAKEDEQEHHLYLIKTEFGLLGWIKLNSPFDYDKREIENLYMRGD